MLVFDDVVKLFGLSPQDKLLDTYLMRLNIVERPEFEENSMEDILREKDGYVLSFRAKHGYEKSWGGGAG